MEIWAHGPAELSIPLGESNARGRLFLHGPRPGSVGEEVPATVRDGLLRFTARQGWPEKHLYLL